MPLFLLELQFGYSTTGIQLLLQQNTHDKMRVSGSSRVSIEAPDYIWYYIEAQVFVEGNRGGIGGGDMGTGDEAGAVWPGLVEPFAERLVYCFDKEGCEPRILVWRRDPECEELDARRAGSDGA